MRLKIEFTLPNVPVPIINQHLVNGYAHKLIGTNNSFHDKPSDYCISQLCGGKLNIEDKTLSYSNSPYIIITSMDMELMNKIIVGAMNKREFNFGMEFKNFTFIEEHINEGWNHFFTLSPILLKENVDGKSRFITCKDEIFKEKLTLRIKNKLLKINSDLDLSDFKITFGNSTNKVKKIMVKNVINHASVVQISFFSSKKVATMLYNLGIGQSTGSGFGTIYKVENFDLYKF